MARNGSGTFNRLYDWTDERDAGNDIDSTKMDAEMDGMATALTDSIAKNGETTPTANLPMGGFKHTGVAVGSARTDYARLDQLQDGGATVLGSVSGTDTITAVASPSIPAYAAGQRFAFVAAGANTGAVTLNINGLGAKAVTKNGATALVAGDIASGAAMLVQYDGTRFQDIGLRQPNNATIPNDLTVTNDLTVSNDAAVTGNATVGGTFGVTGAATLSSTLALNGIVTRGDIPVVNASGVLSQKAIGTNGQILRSDGTDPGWSAPTGATAYEDLTNGGANDLTQVEFSPPAWATVILLSWNQASFSGSDDLDGRLGDASSVESSGYVGNFSSSVADLGALSTEIQLATVGALGRTTTGTLLLTLIDASTNTWAYFGISSREVSTVGFHVAGVKSLTGPLTRVVLKSSGTNTFDNGNAAARYL